ncbi:unnamed protein product [Porites lobata]|uniref:Nuclear pore complex protein Nup88 n=1 Tax=Porites lobata TaxID=104759 RepID=A0ABN8NCM4_9CNID|nr:unnamed protein product [Porites lobata]
MAAREEEEMTSKWQNRLPDHSVFRELRNKDEDNSLQTAEDAKESKTKNIFLENDGELFVWNSAKSSLLTANLKNLHFDNERADKFQTFVCTKAPLFDVDSMLFSPSSKYLALIGERGIVVLEMPIRWGKFAEYDGGEPSVMCRTIPVDARFFVTHQKIKVLDVKWHPGSHTDVHLMVLTSDNNLRLYNVLKPTSPEELIPLGESSSMTAEYSRKSMSVGSMSSFAAALGETAIAFDFAPAVNVVDLKGSYRSSETDAEVAHPIFILRENGDIYYLVHKISSSRHRRAQVNGPLSMYPAADDNYGLDACSLLCLHSQPPIVAMGTGSGKIYHCIVLESEETFDPEEEIASWNRHGVDTTDDSHPKLSLYVNECIELQMSLLPDTTESQSDRSSTEDDSDENEESLVLRLQQDPVSPYQYHCSHRNGVHTVSLPWVKKLQGFCAQDGQSNFDPDEAAVVYHMICTSPAGSSSSSPVLGVCVVNSRILGSSMLCLTSDMECIVRPLSLLSRVPSPPTIETDQEKSYESAGFSPIRQLNVGLFRTQIQQILTRNTSTPLLRAGEESEKLSQEDCFQLLIQAQEILRKEYIQKQNKAREEIEKRISILKDQKEKQKQHLDKLQNTSEELTEQTEMLGEKLVDVSENYHKLLGRLEGLYKYIHNGISVLSLAETNMKKELEEIETFLKFHKESLQQIKAKRSYSLRKSPRKSMSPSKLPVVSTSQQRSIKKIMTEENDMITDLVNQVKELKVQVGL